LKARRDTRARKTQFRLVARAAGRARVSAMTNARAEKGTEGENRIERRALGNSGNRVAPEHIALIPPEFKLNPAREETGFTN
jgi:hypothetical protein